MYLDNKVVGAEVTRLLSYFLVFAHRTKFVDVVVALSAVVD